MMELGQQPNTTQCFKDDYVKTKQDFFQVFNSITHHIYVMTQEGFVMDDKQDQIHTIYVQLSHLYRHGKNFIT